ncbi:hypothetical protein VUR80DRAFT_5473 [Thermomyces stellatus]
MDGRGRRKCVKTPSPTYLQSLFTYGAFIICRLLERPYHFNGTLGNVELEIIAGPVEIGGIALITKGEPNRRQQMLYYLYTRLA